MLEPILSGLFLGLILSFFIGPVFFMIINTSVRKGLKAALSVAFGVMCSDAFFVSLTILGSTQIHDTVTNKYVGMAGGMVLIVFGLNMIFKKHIVKAPEDNSAVRSAPFYAYFLKGFVMNTLNPFVFFFWLGVASTVVVKEGFSLPASVAFYSAALSFVFIGDFSKAYLAGKLKKVMTPKFFLWVDRISGVALALYGVRIILKTFFAGML